MLTYEIAEEIRDFADNEGRRWKVAKIANHFGYNAEIVRRILRLQSFMLPERQQKSQKYCEADADRMRIEKAFSKDQQLWELALRG